MGIITLMMSDVMLAQVSNPRHEMELPDKIGNLESVGIIFLGGILSYFTRTNLMSQRQMLEVYNIFLYSRSVHLHIQGRVFQVSVRHGWDTRFFKLGVSSDMSSMQYYSNCNQIQVF